MLDSFWLVFRILDLTQLVSIKQKNKANMTIPNEQGLIETTMVLLSPASLVQHMKVFPSFYLTSHGTLTNLAFVNLNLRFIEN